MPLLELKNIAKSYQNAVAVRDFSLDVAEGEFVSFLGPSGCGKTTTLRMIAGFERPDGGTIRLEGKDITNTPPNQRNVGMVFQSYALFPNMNVAQNIGFGLKLARRPQQEIARRVAEMLEMIHMEGYGNRYPYQMSGGQQQRVALARAIAIQPQVLLLDEPLSALDAKIRVELREEIRRIQRELNLTTIYVTHDQEEALSLSDRVVVMSAGEVEQIGPPFEIYNYPKTAFTASFIGHLNHLTVDVLDGGAGRFAWKGAEIQVEDTKPVSGKQALLAIRPEEMRLGGDNDNRLPGTVEAISFLGSIVRVKVDVGGTILAVDLFSTRSLTLPKAGDAVEVTFSSQACWVAE